MTALRLKAALFAGLALAAFPALAADLRIGLNAPVTSIDPHFANAAPNSAFARHIFETLVVRSPEGRPMPNLALSWTPVSDTEWEFKLRPGVTWHDGKPFTAEDVIFSFNRIPNVPNSPASFAGNIRTVTKVEAVDPLTLRITTSAPTPNLPIDLAGAFIVSRHVGEGASTADYNSGKAAIGTGPYRLLSYAAGSGIEVERNPAWWGPKQDWDRVSFRIIPNPGARTAALLSGDVDLIAAPSSTDLPRLRQEANIRIFERLGSRSLFLSPDFSRTGDSPFITDNEGRPLGKNPLLDLRVRQALSLAISRQGLAERVQQGMAEPTGQWMPQGAFGHNATVPVPAQDLNRARALLAEAGYPQGFRLTLHASNDRYPADGQTAQAVAQMWSRVGVATTVETLPFQTYLTRMSRQEFSMVQNSWGSTTGEAGSLLLNIIHSYDRERRLGASNDTRYVNEALDRQIEEALSTMDPALREQRIAAAVKVAVEDLGMIPMILYKTAWAARRPLVYEPRMDEQTLVMSVSR
ncbi:ABC transporter substrate-binding protein [Pseudoroseomonas cervicalis]|uniref:ABC transporter, substrate-binding protein, family 5 n=1 Tax=Pseudoroseomonas cervicalis ATCC 49957 TaxID=525371 RepID=D5RS72_9PROT|nr:ABC transporter substrate-binding protein [Pseudoroseomonas cervicalis]EFH09838.1 ABC transporter, substrate-binding protein, family 5 [Pseudoroseomonas cervicalis ATCC 49957]